MLTPRRSMKARQVVPTSQLSHVETPQEMVDRLSLIALGERDCDLSDNDATALEWLLTTHRELLETLRAIVDDETEIRVGLFERAQAVISKAECATGNHASSSEIGSVPSEEP